MPRFTSAEDALKAVEDRLTEGQSGLNEVDLSVVMPEGSNFSTTGIMELTFAGLSLGIEGNLRRVVIKVNELQLASEDTRAALQKWLTAAFDDGCTVEMPAPLSRLS